MAAMISRWEFGFSRVLAFQHSGRMRDAYQEHCVFTSFSSGIVKGATGMLLKHVVNVLNACEITLPNAIQPLVKPPNRWPERHTVITDFPFGLQFFQRLPE